MARVRADIVNLATSAPVSQLGDIFACDFSLGLGKIGEFQISVPQADPKVAAVSAGAHEIRIHHEGEGEVFRGIVETVESAIDSSGRHVAVLSGPSVARELVWTSTDLGLEYNGVTLSVAVNDLLTGTDWSMGSIASPANLVLMRIDARTVWEALVAVAKLFNYDVRENPVSRTIDVGAFGDASGIRAFNFSTVGPGIASANADDNVKHFPLSNFQYSSDASDVVTQIIPLGAGEGETLLTLEWSTRSSPYTISNFVGPDGKTRYYIANNVGTYGARRKYMSWSDIVPLSNSLAGFQAAANALYDSAADKLTRISSPLITMDFEMLGFEGGSLDVGDLMDVSYSGSVYAGSGLNNDFGRGPNNIRSVFDYQGSAYIMDLKRSWSEDGAPQTAVTVATARQRARDGMTKVSELQSAITTVQVALKPYTYRELHVLNRQSIASGSTAILKCNFDANVFLGLQYKLSFFVRPIRSNVSVAGSPSSNTSGPSSATSSQSGTSHSHTINMGTVAADGLHRHQVWGNDPDNTHYDIGFPTGAMTAIPNTSGTNESTSHGHTETGTTTLGNSVPHTHQVGAHTHYLTAKRVYMNSSSAIPGVYMSVHLVMSNAWADASAWTYDAGTTHSHTITGTTAVNESSHTHNIPHTHDMASHTHTLTYGIYNAPNPSNPGITITVDGVSVAGGPWNTVNSLVTVDVSSYIIDGNGQPKRSTFDIVFSSSVLCDIEAVLRSLVSATSAIPV